MRKFTLSYILLSSLCCWAQSYITVTGSQVGGASLVTGTILFQATGTNGAAISYQVGGGGQQINSPTSCAVTAGAIANTCQVANVLLTSPQNFCFAVTVKNTAGQVVIGGAGAHNGYQCLQVVPNNAWCVGGTCNFDNYTPNLPAVALIVNLPPPYSLTLGGVFAGDCAPGTVSIGYNSTGHVDCGPGGTEGGAMWGGITGLLSDQTDLQAALSLLAPTISPNFLGTPTSVTAALNDNSTQIATDAWVKAQGYAPANAPTFTGLVTIPTVATNDSSNTAASTAWVNAQNYGAGAGNMTGPGSSAVNNIVLFNSTNGQLTKDAGFGFPLAATHVGTFAVGANGFVASAFSDTTNAANLITGILPASRLPSPTTTTLGGVKSLTAPAHQWLNGISTAGGVTSSQPACADLSNAVASCSSDTTNASNIITGTLPPARIGVFAAGANGFVASAFTDTTNATNIATGTLAAARVAQVSLAASGNGGVGGTLPAANVSAGYPATSVSGTLPAGQVGSGYPFASLAGTASVAVAGVFTNLTSTCAGAQTWALGGVGGFVNASITLTGACTLNTTGLVTGAQYVLKVIQGSGGSHTLALGTGCSWKVVNGGGGVITPSVTAGALDTLAFTYDGVNCIASYGKNYN